jgi:hypothetical protein
MTQKTILVAAPAYDGRFAGVRVLHELCNGLNAIGVTAYIVFYEFQVDSPPRFFFSASEALYAPEHGQILRPHFEFGSDLANTLIQESIVIYPEVIRGNPISATNVVRYVLKAEEANKYPMFHDENDFIMVYDRSFMNDVDFVFPIYFTDYFKPESLFNDLETVTFAQRKLDVTYYGKGPTYAPCYKLPKTLAVDRYWPDDKEGLALVLKNTRFFYTWDPMTHTNFEALLCGAIPVFLRFFPMSEKMLSTEAGILPCGQVARAEDGSASFNFNFDDFEMARQAYIAQYRYLAESLQARLPALVEKIFSKFS